MNYAVAMTAQSFLQDEVRFYMECLGRINPALPDVLREYLDPPPTWDFRKVRDRYERATRSFMGLLALMGPGVFDQIGRPGRLATLMGAPPPERPKSVRFARWIYEPSTGLRWPSATMLAFDLGVTYNSVYFHLRPSRRLKTLKRRTFAYVIPRNQKDEAQ